MEALIIKNTSKCPTLDIYQSLNLPVSTLIVHFLIYLAYKSVLITYSFIDEIDEKVKG